LSLRNVEDLLAERGIDICHEAVRFWWNRFGPMFAAEIRRKRVQHMRAYTHWRWHLDEIYVKINGQMHYLWRAVDHEGEVLEESDSVDDRYRRNHDRCAAAPNVRSEAAEAFAQWPARAQSDRRTQELPRSPMGRWC
jgi:transposase-like protein